jgi:hypothetical protein
MPQGNDRTAGELRLERLALGLALAAVLASATTTAARADDDSILSKIERTIGLKSPNTMEYGINYSERSPLVVPPTRDLPPPQSSASPQVADWPKDPDIAARKAAAVKDKVVPHPDYVLDSSRALRPDELNDVHGTPVVSPGGSSDTSANGTSKKNIFSMDLFKKEQYATFTGEPARATLTDPPPGYLTPSPDQPYGVGPEKAKYHVATPSEHGELQR